jgi:hypothetical protein
VPNGITLPTPTTDLVCTALDNLSGTLTCVVTGTTVTVTNAFGSPVAPPNKIGVQLGKLTNPASTTPDRGPWIVKSKTPAGYLIDQSND